MILGQLLKDHREKCGLSVRQMGAKIGVQHDALWRFEKGRPIKATHLAAIIRWLFGSS